MKFAAVLALSLGGANAQLVCDIILPNMVSIDIQNDECCAAANVLLSASVIASGQGMMLQGQCLHQRQYSQYFPEGCTKDCAGPTDDAILNCVAGSSPKINVLYAAQHVACCNVYEDYGGSCQSAIFAGAKTGTGGMNAVAFGEFDQNGDHVMDFCVDFPCPTDPPPTDPCVCKPTWSMSQFNSNCADQLGCPAEACDNDRQGPWCEVVNPGCDGSWAKFDGENHLRYCSPPTEPTPGGNCRDCTNASANRSLLFSRLPCCSN
jgi:hypothetical protein